MCPFNSFGGNHRIYRPVVVRFKEHDDTVLASPSYPNMQYCRRSSSRDSLVGKSCAWVDTIVVCVRAMLPVDMIFIADTHYSFNPRWSPPHLDQTHRLSAGLELPGTVLQYCKTPRQPHSIAPGCTASNLQTTNKTADGR